MLLTAKVASLFLLRYAALAAAQGSVPADCAPCTNFVADANRTANISITAADDTARFYSAGSGGSILVAFDAIVTFSHPPANVSQGSFVVKNGSVLAVSIVQACSQVKLQGFARQDRAWSETNATVAISLPLLHDCSGAKFPPASAEKTIINRPICSIYTTNLTAAAKGAVLSGTSAGLALACSQPVSGINSSAISVTLTPDAVSTTPAAGLLPSVLASANTSGAALSEPACDTTGWSVSRIAALANAQTYYSMTVELPPCFYGKVTVALTEPLYNPESGSSLPLQPLSFWRVKHALVSTLSSSLTKTAAMVDYVEPIPGYSDAESVCSSLM